MLEAVVRSVGQTLQAVAYHGTAPARLAVSKRQSMIQPLTTDAIKMPSAEDSLVGATMCGIDTPSEERKRGAAGVFARLLFQSVGSKCRLPGKWREDAYKPEAIDEARSASLMELSLAKWPPRFRLSIHSDDGGSLVGYGVFRPTGMNRRSDDTAVREYLAARVSGGGMGTPRHWAWYREVDEPMRDFAQQETLGEVKKIRQGQQSKGYDAFQRAGDDLARLAEALDAWYSNSSYR